MRDVSGHPRLTKKPPARGRADLPPWVTEELIAETLRVWQPRYRERLTRDDAIGILSTVGRVFGVLSRR